MIDVDTPAGLVRRHCPQRTVVLSLATPGGDEVFGSLAGVQTVRRDGATYTLTGAGEDFVTEVIRLLSEASLQVTDFRTVLPNLEDVFLELTGHRIRD